MKTAIVSDIHGNWDGFNTVLEDIKSRQVDRIICLGDVVDGGEENDAFVHWLKANNITTVRGNHDENYNCKLEPENKKWLNQLPQEIVEESVIFTHISPRVKQKKLRITSKRGMYLTKPITDYVLSAISIFRLFLVMKAKTLERQEITKWTAGVMI